MIWHIWILVIISAVAMVLTIILRTTGPDRSHILKAEEVAKIEASYLKKEPSHAA